MNAGEPRAGGAARVKHPPEGRRKTFTVIVTDRRIYRVSVDPEHLAASDPEHAAIDLVDGPDPGLGTVELIAIESTAETVADAEAHPPSAG